MSTVFYRWGAGRDESRVTFDGTHISVFDLKREIILNNKMGNGKDFDIGIYDNVTGEGMYLADLSSRADESEFKDDNHQIPRSSSLIARRLPSSIRGRGNAQNYIVGTAAADALNNQHRLETHAVDQMKEKMNRGVRGAGGTFGALSKRFDGKEEKKVCRPLQVDIPADVKPGEPVQITTGDAEEDARIKAMLGQEADQWEQTLEDMSTYATFGCKDTADILARREAISSLGNLGQLRLAQLAVNSTTLCLRKPNRQLDIFAIDVDKRVTGSRTARTTTIRMLQSGNDSSE